MSISQGYRSYIAVNWESGGISGGGNFGDTGISRGYPITSYSISSTDEETRPVNYAIKVWKRIN